jgi:tetratricopeptide (TPR) repeat protein
MITTTINKKNYTVEKDEFNRITRPEYENLIIYEGLALYDKIHFFLKELSQLFSIPNLYVASPTHGGFTLVECSPYFNSVMFTSKKPHQILHNTAENNVKNVCFFTPTIIKNETLVFIDSFDTIDIDWIDKEMPLILSRFSIDFLKDMENREIYTTIFQIQDTDLMLFVPDRFCNAFFAEYNTMIDPHSRILRYDNLVELCVMVKDGGKEFERALTENLHWFDRWTILDTGSTDGTVEMVRRVLSPYKRGNLYEEPFIDFCTSRNRCLELAGKRCRYVVMLDDTYIIRGGFRTFLQNVRNDQYSDSFSLYIKSDDVEYASNRVLNCERNLQYFHKIHEVIQEKNNVNVIIPHHVATIEDVRSDYMFERTMDRKKYDLKVLFEEIRENARNTRAYYYVGQTYNLVKNYILAYVYFRRRGEMEEGFLQERVDAVFEAARLANFKLELSWEESRTLYEKAYELDKSRPDSLYFLGIHEYIEGSKEKAFYYLKQAFQLGYPLHCQYGLKPTLSFIFIPRFLAELCYDKGEIQLGLQCCEYYMSKNKPEEMNYKIMRCFHGIFQALIQYGDLARQVGANGEQQDISCVFNLQQGGQFSNIMDLLTFIAENNPKKCCLVDSLEYVPLLLLTKIPEIYVMFSKTENIGMILPNNDRIKNLLCCGERVKNAVQETFPMFLDKILQI